MNSYISTFKSTITNIWGECTIDELITPISDVLVTINDNSGLMFTVKFIQQTEDGIDSIDIFKKSLTTAFLRQGAPKVPITIVRVNEEKQMVEICIAVSWDMGIPMIEDEFSFKPLSNLTAESIKSNLLTADNTIRLPNIQYCKIVKRIRFTYGTTKQAKIGEVIYLREFGPTYKMNMKQPVSAREDFERKLNGIPENEFPSDWLDDAILQAVKKKYPDATCRSSLLLFNTDFKSLKTELNNVWDSHGIQIVLCPATLQASPLTWTGCTCPTINIDLLTQKKIWNNDDYLPETSYEALLDYPDIDSFTKATSGIIGTVKRVKDI